jgi:hypothetical protein
MPAGHAASCIHPSVDCSSSRLLEIGRLVVPACEHGIRHHVLVRPPCLSLQVSLRPPLSLAAPNLSPRLVKLHFAAPPRTTCVYLPPWADLPSRVLYWSPRSLGRTYIDFTPPPLLVLFTKLTSCPASLPHISHRDLARTWPDLLRATNPSLVAVLISPPPQPCSSLAALTSHNGPHGG